MSGSQSWNFIHWDQPKYIFFQILTNLFCLFCSFLTKTNFAGFKDKKSLRGRHSNCLCNLLKIQKWAGNTEKRIIGQNGKPSRVEWRFRKSNVVKLHYMNFTNQSWIWADLLKKIKWKQILIRPTFNTQICFKKVVSKNQKLRL